jgi:hypothetical protein
MVIEVLNSDWEPLGSKNGEAYFKNKIHGGVGSLSHNIKAVHENDLIFFCGLNLLREGAASNRKSGCGFDKKLAHQIILDTTGVMSDFKTKPDFSRENPNRDAELVELRNNHFIRFKDFNELEQINLEIDMHDFINMLHGKYKNLSSDLIIFDIDPCDRHSNILILLGKKTKGHSKFEEFKRIELSSKDLLELIRAEYPQFIDDYIFVDIFPQKVYRKNASIISVLARTQIG